MFWVDHPLGHCIRGDVTPLCEALWNHGYLSHFIFSVCTVFVCSLIVAIDVYVYRSNHYLLLMHQCIIILIAYNYLFDSSFIIIIIIICLYVLTWLGRVVAILFAGYMGQQLNQVKDGKFDWSIRTRNHWSPVWRAEPHFCWIPKNRSSGRVPGPLQIRELKDLHSGKLT